MKAERRHELQTNTLAKAMTRAPEAWQKYGGRVLFLLAAAILAFVLVRYRIQTSRAAEESAQQNLSVARTLIQELSNFDTLRAQPQQLTILREDAARSLDASAEGSDDPRTLAEILIARGDLYWTLASIPQAPATQPTTAPAASQRSPEQLLDDAAKSYQAVLDQYADQTPSAVAARFGLAAIAENREQWDVARQHYEAVQNASAAAEVYREQSKRRIELLPELQKPILIVEPTPATQPATQAVAATQPTTAPTTSPSIER
jgi:hypothetical protein